MMNFTQVNNLIKEAINLLNNGEIKKSEINIRKLNKELNLFYNNKNKFNFLEEINYLCEYNFDDLKVYNKLLTYMEDIGVNSEYVKDYLKLYKNYKYN